MNITVSVNDKSDTRVGLITTNKNKKESMKALKTMINA